MGMFRDRNGTNEVLDFGKHVGKTLRQVHLEDQGYCDWAVRQVPPSAPKLSQLKYFLRRMSDLTRKNEGMCRKASEVERQLGDRVLEVCCEEKMAKLSRQEAKMMEEKRTRQQKDRDENKEENLEGESEEELRGRITWADMEDEGDFEGEKPTWN